MIIVQPCAGKHLMTTQVVATGVWLNCNMLCHEPVALQVSDCQHLISIWPMRKEYLYDHVSLWLVNFQLEWSDDQSYCQTTCKVWYTMECELHSDWLALNQDVASQQDAKSHENHRAAIWLKQDSPELAKALYCHQTLDSITEGWVWGVN